MRLAKNVIKHGVLIQKTSQNGIRAPQNRAKYGARCISLNGRVRGCLYFTVFAAIYLNWVSENPVKYGARCAVTVHSLTVACILRCLRHCVLRNPVKYGARCAGTVHSLTVACILRCLRH